MSKQSNIRQLNSQFEMTKDFTALAFCEIAKIAEEKRRAKNIKQKVIDM